MRVCCVILVTYALISMPHRLTEASTKLTARYSERLCRTLCLHYKDLSMLGFPIKTPAANTTEVRSERCGIHRLGDLTAKNSRFSRRRCSVAHDSDKKFLTQHESGTEPEICKNVTNLASARKEDVWPDGIVYYRYKGSLGEATQRTFNRKVTEIENKTCVKFREYVEGQASKDYVLIRKADGAPCETEYLGRKGGEQTFDVGEDCKLVDGMLRQLLRIIGLGHMHVRPDRNFQIAIHWEYVDQRFTTEFCRSKESIRDYVNRPYDVNSVTHFSSREKSKYGYDAITSHHCLKDFGPSTANNKLVRADIHFIKMLYGCYDDYEG